MAKKKHRKKFRDYAEMRLRKECETARLADSRTRTAKAADWASIFSCLSLIAILVVGWTLLNFSFSGGTLAVTPAHQGDGQPTPKGSVKAHFDTTSGMSFQIVDWTGDPGDAASALETLINAQPSPPTNYQHQSVLPAMCAPVNAPNGEPIDMPAPNPPAEQWMPVPPAPGGQASQANVNPSARGDSRNRAPSHPGRRVALRQPAGDSAALAAAQPVSNGGQVSEGDAWLAAHQVGAAASAFAAQLRNNPLDLPAWLGRGHVDLQRANFATTPRQHLHDAINHYSGAVETALYQQCQPIGDQQQFRGNWADAYLNRGNAWRFLARELLKTKAPPPSSLQYNQAVEAFSYALKDYSEALRLSPDAAVAVQNCDEVKREIEQALWKQTQVARRDAAAKAAAAQASAEQTNETDNNPSSGTSPTPDNSKTPGATPSPKASK